MAKTRFVALILLITKLTSSCSVKPEKPGLCALKCGGAIIAPRDPGFSITPLSQPGTLKCSAAGDFGVVQVQFLIAEKTGDSAAAPDPTAGVGAGLMLADTVRETTVPSISFEPVIYGAMSPNTKPEDNDETRFQGVVTPAANWCSDSCGVMSLELVPTCVPDETNEVSIQAHSGALYSDPVKMSVDFNQ